MRPDNPGHAQKERSQMLNLLQLVFPLAVLAQPAEVPEPTPLVIPNTEKPPADPPDPETPTPADDDAPDQPSPEDSSPPDADTAEQPAEPPPAPSAEVAPENPLPEQIEATEVVTPSVAPAADKTDPHEAPEVRGEDRVESSLDVDVRLSFTVTDPDLKRDQAHGAGLSLGPPTRLFFEDHDKEDIGYSQGFYVSAIYERYIASTGINLEIGFVARLRLPTVNGLVEDDSSYLKLSRPTKAGTLILTAFPFTADRFQLGYSRGVAWGDRRVMNLEDAQAWSPGARLELVTAETYGFFGTKTGRSAVDDGFYFDRPRTAWGLLAGAGFRIADMVAFDLGGGYFSRGKLPAGWRVEDPEPLEAQGVAVQLSHYRGLAPHRPVDFRPLSHDPFVTDSVLAKHEPHSDFAYCISAEMSVVSQSLREAEDRDRVTSQSARAADVSARIRHGSFSADLLFAWRTVEFLLLGRPGYPRYTALPEDAESHAETSFAATVAYRFDSAGIGISASFGVIRPAYYSGEYYYSWYFLSPTSTVPIVVRRDGQVRFMREDDEIAKAYEGKSSIQWRLGNWVALVFDVFVRHDPNYRYSEDNRYGIPRLLERDDQTDIGINLILRARASNDESAEVR